MLILTAKFIILVITLKFLLFCILVDNRMSEHSDDDDYDRNYGYDYSFKSNMDTTVIMIEPTLLVT